MENYNHTLATKWKAQNISEKTGIQEADILTYLNKEDINRYYEDLRNGRYGYKDFGRGSILTIMACYFIADEQYTLTGIIALGIVATIANPFVERYFNKRLGQLITTAININRKAENFGTDIVIDMERTSPTII